MRQGQRSAHATAASAESALVGRAVEVAHIGRALARVAGGESGLLAFDGVPGVGVSRLAGEATMRASAAGFATATGHAAGADEGIAYAPFVEAFGALLRGMDGTRRHTLTAGLPQLALVIGGLDIDAPAPLGDPALERMRIMDGFAQLIGRLARLRPLLIVLDDAHALDTASSALLRHIVFTVTDQPILFVIAARVEDRAAGALTRRLSAFGDSSWWWERIEVMPLDDGDAATLLADVVGAPLAAQLTEDVLERCGGLPSFLEAIGRSLAEGGGLVTDAGVLSYAGDRLPLPGSIKDQLDLRLAALTENDRMVMRVVAVAGGRCDYALLAATCEFERAQLVAALDRLLGNRLLVEEASESGYALAYGMLRDAVLAALSDLQRRLCHSALAAGLERVRPRDPGVVEHLLRAGPLVEPHEFIPRALAAARRAQSVGAVEDAERYFTAAREAALAHPEVAMPADILAELGALCSLAGNSVDARRYWREALSEYLAAGNPLGVSTANRELGMLAWLDGDGEHADAYLAASGAALDGLEPGAEQAELAYARMTAAVRIGDAQTVQSAAASLTELAERLASPSLSIRALLAEAARQLTAMDFAPAELTNLRALELAQVSNEPMLCIRAYDQLSVGACIQGDMPTLRRYSEASLEIVHSVGAGALEPWPRMRLAVADLLTGQWDAALRTTSDVLAFRAGFGEQRGRISVMGTHIWLLTRRGKLADAHRYLGEVHELVAQMTGSDTRVSGAVAVAHTVLALAEQNYDEAVAAAQSLSAPYATWYPLIALMLRGEAFARSGRTADAAAVSEEVRGIGAWSTPLPNAVAAWIDGIAAADADLLTSSSLAFDSLGFPYLTARARLERAELVAERDRDASIDGAGRALADFDELGAQIEAQRARLLLRSLGAVPSRGRRHRTPGSQLSTRELEVALLVASGRSSAAIATELFISPRTVTTHLDHIYQRLGLSSRAALTRYLADSGLLESGRLESGQLGSSRPGRAGNT